MVGSATGPVSGEGADKGLFAALDRWVFRIERLFALIAAVSIFALMLLGVAQIFGRKLFNAPIFGYIDLVELSMGVFAFLAIAYCERLGGHVRMELLVGFLRGRLLWLFEFVSILVALFVVGVLAYYGYTHALRAYEFGDSTIDAQYPMWPSKALVPLAFGLLWIRLLLLAYGYGRLLVNPRLKPVGVPTIADVAAQARREAEEAQAVEQGAAEARR
jgi:TRAP-type C4-dicarboxylate transport system permease small subunit